MRKAALLLLIAVMLSSIAVAGYQVDKANGYEDGYFTATITNDNKILISGVTGSLVEGQTVDWFKAKDGRFGDWMHVTIVDGMLDIQVISCPLKRYC